MKKGFIVITIAVFIAIFSFVWADTNGVWHRAEDIVGGVFGQDEQGETTDYTFINPVNFNDSVIVNSGIEVDVIKSNNADGNVVIQLG